MVRTSAALRAFVCLGAVCLLAPSDALAKKKKGCSTAAEVTSKLWNAFGPAATAALRAAGPQGATAATVMQGIDKGIRTWNTLIAGNSWARIGPRRLHFDKPHKGTIIGSGTRTFISPVPSQRPVTIDLVKRDGKGKIDVTVCTIDENNKARQIKRFKIKKNTKDGKRWKIKVPAHGKIVKVLFRGKSFSKKFAYTLNARSKGGRQNR